MYPEPGAARNPRAVGVSRISTGKPMTASSPFPVRLTWMRIVRTPRLIKVVKRLQANQERDLEEAVRAAAENPAMGDRKAGELDWQFSPLQLLRSRFGPSFVKVLQLAIERALREAYEG